MKKRIVELINILNEAAFKYYQEDIEIMSNEQYDKLYDELLELEESTGIIYSNSPTQKVGYEVVSNLPKVQHKSKMLSLDKTKEVSKLKEFLDNKEGLLSWKLDGLTVVLTYKDGMLFNAVTRGNGEIGELVTNNAKVFKNIPLKIKYKNELIVRGEAIIKYSDFNKINDKLDDVDKYKNPRNLCSGTVRQLNNEITSKRNVNFYAFNLVDSTHDFDYKEDEFDFLKDLGFDVVEYFKVDKDNVDDTVEQFKKDIITYDIPSDGLVLTYNDIRYAKTLGSTSKFPRHSIAFKWMDEMKETTILDIIWNTSRTGLINPVAVFEPVELEGTTVRQASLHNVSILESLEIGILDRVKVYKANMIIPQISENLTRSNNYTLPKNCNACGGDVIVKKEKNTKVLYCSNDNCTAKLLKSISHFVSRNCANIEGFSEATIDKFIDMKIINNIIDIYNIDKYQDIIVNMDGFGEKSYNNLINSINKSKDIKLYNLINALGIQHIGLANSKLISKYINDDPFKLLMLTYDELISIEGFGEKIVESFMMYFKNINNYKMYNELISILNILKEEMDSDVLTDKVFVITGSLTEYSNRDELKEVIEKNGGKVTNTVTSNTDYLINNNINSSSSKNKKAKELGVNIITENDFKIMIKEGEYEE